MYFFLVILIWLDTITRKFDKDKIRKEAMKRIVATKKRTRGPWAFMRSHE